MSSPQHIAFYGTLKQGSTNPFTTEISQNLHYVGKCEIIGRLYDLGRIPALKLNIGGKVQAELYEVINDDVLRLLDEYEAIDNIDPNHPGFKRVKASILDSSQSVWVYEYNGTPDEDQQIESGNWPTQRNLSVKLALRTDSPKAEIYLYDFNNAMLAKDLWYADRKLADQLLPHIQALLASNSVNMKDICGIIIFTGEGSFTGLRIGTTVANTLAYSLSTPVTSSTGNDWLQTGLRKIVSAKSGNYVLPKYSSPPNITKPRT